jgi:hydrophobe/amphiphile efflux-1 (HAE1) family protein
MSISTPFIKRPVATSLLTFALALAGWIAFMFLPVAPIPQVEYPTISAFANLPGASPDVMASAVATPLERMFGRIAGVTEMTSNSSQGSANITLQFDLNRNIDAAARDVQAALNAARGQLPVMPSNPNYRKVNPADSPILVLALTSEVVDRSKMYDIADSVLAQKLAQVKGVGQVNLFGSSKPAVRIQVNPGALTKYDIGWEQITSALNAANANRPKGSISDDQRMWQIDTSDQLFTAAEYAPLIVSYKNGAAVRLSDIATVTDSLENRRNLGLANGKPAILINLTKQPSANIIDTVDNVYALLPQLKASIPPSVDLSILVDRTTTIRASIADIEYTILISIGLVILVVFIFLRNAWATIIPSISVPLSLLGTFGVMYLLGYSVDNLSLMALAISTGFVVDDAIVVIENIARYLEQGLTPVAAALRGAQEISFTVLSMSVSLIAVFIPILLMGGIVGRLFREFSVTLAIAIVTSLVVSLTTTPAMCARFLRPSRERHRGKVHQFYGTSLGWVLRHPLFMLGVTVGTACLSIYLYIVVPKGFFPQQDTGRLMGNVQVAPDVSFAISSQKLIEFSEIVRQDPAVENVSASAGGGGFGGGGNINIQLKPIEERKISADQVVARLRPKLARVAGAQLFLQSPQDISIGGRASNSQFQYSVQADTPQEAQKWAAVILDKMLTLPELRDSNTDLQNRGLQTTLTYDRDTASRLGLTPASMDTALYDALGQRQVSTMYKPLNQYHVVMEIDPRFQTSPDSLKDIYVRSTNGVEVPLSAVTKYDMGNTAQRVNHQGQFPSVTLSFNIAPGVALGDAVAAVDRATKEMILPATVHASFQGTAQAFQASLSNQPYLILAALMTVYLVLGMLYESYIHPITILSTLPSAGVGALLALVYTKMELNVIALIGIILLIGIVKKNAIMMIDFALEAERRDGLSPVDAIYQACLLRFRPITMTTMAAMLGGLPLALGTGTGAELRRPLGITIVGGLMVSQLLTLYTTPVVYLYLDRLRLLSERTRVRLRRRSPHPSPQPTH